MWIALKLRPSSRASLMPKPPRNQTYNVSVLNPYFHSHLRQPATLVAAVIASVFLILHRSLFDCIIAFNSCISCTMKASSLGLVNASSLRALSNTVWVLICMSSYLKCQVHHIHFRVRYSNRMSSDRASLLVSLLIEKGGWSGDWLMNSKIARSRPSRVQSAVTEVVPDWFFPQQIHAYNVLEKPVFFIWKRCIPSKESWK